jgi:hypothetical protein
MSGDVRDGQSQPVAQRGRGRRFAKRARHAASIAS